MLEAAGIGSAEEAVYRTLLGMPPVALAVLAERLECGAAEVAALIDTLEAKGLVSRVAGEGQRVVAAPPELAIAPWGRSPS